MKPTILTSFLILLLSFSCGQQHKPGATKVKFSIYETVKLKDVPATILESLKKSNLILSEEAQSPVIATVSKNDSLHFPVIFAEANIKVLRTIYPAQPGMSVYELIATKSEPAIDISDLQKSIASGKEVELRFNMKGAKKFAEMTKNNAGNIIVFAIDDQVYSAPHVLGEIRYGVAIIAGLESEEQAKKISESLNASIPE